MTSNRKNGKDANVAPTDDDAALAWQLYCNMVMDSHSLVGTLPNRSEQVLKRRLAKLSQQSDPYFHRLNYVSDKMRNEPGSEPKVYALANRGAKIINASRDDVSVPVTRWANRVSNWTHKTIEHERASARLMARLSRGANLADDDVRLLYQEEFEPEIRKKRRKVRGKKNAITAEINGWYGHSRAWAIAPDRIFAIDAADARRYIFVEIDQGTESIAPENLTGPNFWKKSTPLQKFVVYWHAWRKKAHVDQFGIPTFQVLTMTTTPSHADSMREAIATHLPDARDGLFLFGDWETYNQWEGNPLAFPWLTVKGREQPLI